MRNLKILWLVTASVLLITMLLSGCGAANGAKNTATPTTAPETTTATPAPTEEPKPELKVLLSYAATDYNTYPVAKVLEEATGYHVVYEMLPKDKPEDKLNLLMASGQSYDMVNTLGNAVMKGLFVEYAKRGALLDLTQMIESFGPNVKASVSQENLDTLKIDNKIYTIPNPAIPVTYNTLAIRQDWLDKLGLQAPTTVEEFVTVLKAFKEKDPGGNKENNIPFTVNAADLDVMGINAANLVGAFGMPSGWNEVDGKLLPRLLNPNFKSYLSLCIDLYKQGLLDKEFATNKDSTVNEKFSSGKAGVIPVNWASVPTVVNALLKNQPDAKITYLKPLTGTSGNKGLLTVSAGFDALSYIPKSAKNPEHAMKWINAKLEKDTHKRISVGIEGVHHTVKDGKYYPILPIFNDELNLAGKYFTGWDKEIYPQYWGARLQKDPKLYEAFDEMNNKVSAEYKKVDVMGFTPPTLTEYPKNNQKLMTMVNDYMIKAIIVDKNTDGLEDFIKKYNAEGGEASIKEVNDWYATFKK